MYLFQNEKSDRADKEIDNIIKQVDKITGKKCKEEHQFILVQMKMYWHKEIIELLYRRSNTRNR